MSAPHDATHAQTEVARPPHPQRRLLTFGVAAAAVAAGAGLAWRQTQSVDGNGGEMDPNIADFWRSEFTTPQSERLTMASFKGKPLLLNFWATWCPPCVEELPLLNGFYQENHSKSWQVLGVAVDKLDAVQRFLSKSPLQFPIAMAGMEGTALSRTLGNLGGGLPFTVVFDRRGRVVHRKMGLLKPDELQTLVQSYSM